jgi:DNA-binding NtrC family response regulator
VISGERQKILIVDDDADTRRLLAALLAPLAAVVSASEGSEALRRIKSARPSVMLLDIVMPGMGGLEVLAAARAVDPGLAVMMLTGGTDIAVAQKALELGAIAYVTKPFDPDVVVDEVRRLLESLGGGPERGPYRPWRVDA